MTGARRDVKGLYGSRSAFGDIDPETTGVLVCTIEKADQLITRLLEDDLMGLLSCIVVDELHMVRCLMHDSCTTMYTPVQAACRG